MASNLKVDTTLRNAMCDAITSAVGASPLLRIYSGTQPAGPATAITTQTLLATLTCSSTFAPAASGGVLTANTITAGTAAAQGIATWYRLCTSGGTGKVDGTVGTASADAVINSTSIVVGGPVSCTSFTYTGPGG